MRASPTKWYMHYPIRDRHVDNCPLFFKVTQNVSSSNIGTSATLLSFFSSAPHPRLVFMLSSTLLSAWSCDLLSPSPPPTFGLCSKTPPASPSLPSTPHPSGRADFLSSQSLKEEPAVEGCPDSSCEDYNWTTISLYLNHWTRNQG